MTIYRYLGYGITDSNGIAKLDHDANGDAIEHSYTGVGAGEIDVVASLDNPIESGSIVSGTYGVIDGVFKDIATTGQKNTNWTVNTGITVRDPDNDGTTVTNSNTSANQYWANNNNYFNMGAFAIEFDIVAFSDGNSGVRIYGSSNNDVIAYFQYMGCSQGSHVKLIIDGYYARYQVDNGTITNIQAITTTNLKFGFRFFRDCNLKYKNFVVYPI